MISMAGPMGVSSILSMASPALQSGKAVDGSKDDLQDDVVFTPAGRVKVPP